MCRVITIPMQIEWTNHKSQRSHLYSQPLSLFFLCCATTPHRQYFSPISFHLFLLCSALTFLLPSFCLSRKIKRDPRCLFSVIFFFPLFSSISHCSHFIIALLFHLFIHVTFPLLVFFYLYYLPIKNSLWLPLFLNNYDNSHVLFFVINFMNHMKENWKINSRDHPRITQSWTNLRKKSHLTY